MNFDSPRRPVAGEVITRNEANHAATRNAPARNGRRPTRYFDAIVKMAAVADDQAAVRFAAAAMGEAELDGTARLEAGFSPAAWTSLKQLQAKYDPRGMFRNAQSLAAALEAAA